LPKQWHVLRCKLYKEHLLWYQLQEAGFEVFFPRLFQRTQSLKRVKVKPFFPGYLFVKVDFNVISISKFQCLPLVRNVVCVDGRPLKVTTPIVEAIRTYVDAINHSKAKSLTSLDESSQQAEDYISVLVDNGLFFENEMTARDRVRLLQSTLVRITRSPEVTIPDGCNKT
jgi:transcription antitermination factor NusG